MKTFISFLLVITFGTFSVSLQAQGTAFIYQGRLNNSGNPAGGNYDFTFALFNNSSTNTGQVGATLTNLDVGVTNGLFALTLDFGANFPGASRWLAIGVRTNGGSSFTALNPLQALTPTPYAIMASSASNLLGALPTGQLSGTVLNSQLAHSSVTVNTGLGLSGGGTVSLGASTALTNTGILSVTGNADITAGTVNGAVTLGDTATSTSTPNTLVKRDATGSFSATNITAAGVFNGNGGGLTNLNGSQIAGGTVALARLPATVVSAAGLLSSFGTLNFFAGQDAGNLAITGTENTGVGAGVMAFNTSGSGNTVIGVNALSANSTGGDNTAVGIYALQDNVTGSLNTAYGVGALGQNGAGDNNTAVGYGALSELGEDEEEFSGGGTNNIALGYQAGSQLSENESGNIEIGNAGVLGENNVIRLGDPTIQTNTFIAGVINGNGGGLTNLNALQLSGIISTSILPGFQGGDNAIGGGQGNNISGQWATIGGGNNNTNTDSNGTAATIAGGQNNIITNGYQPTIGGGYGNNASGSYATISGGNGNTASGEWSSIGGGLNNQATNNNTAVPGGANNIAGGLSSFAAGLNAQAINNHTFVWSDGSATTTSFASDQFMARASGGVVFLTSSAASPTSYATGSAGVALLANGTAWTTISDRNAKKNFQPVDTAAMLDKLAAIPIQQWNYKWEKDSDVPNIGPMAQDFKHAFYPGRDDRGITTLEFDGVELAAIQALNQKLDSETKAKDAEIKRLKLQNDLLAERLNELEVTVKQLAAQK